MTDSDFYQCSLEHHDIAALEREINRDVPNIGHRRGASKSQPLPPSNLSNIPQSSITQNRSASTGQINFPSFGTPDAFLGLSQNVHHLQPIPSNSANDPQSPFRDFLSDIQPVGSLPSGAPFNLSVLGLELDSPSTGNGDRDLFYLGVLQEGSFICEGEGCRHSFEDIPSLEDHFEAAHFQFTRINPAHQYRCSACERQEPIEFQICVGCDRLGTCQIRVYGRALYAPQPHAPEDQDDPYDLYSADDLPSSRFGNHGSTQGMDSEMGGGSEHGSIHQSGGSYNYGNNTSTYHAPSPLGGSNDSNNSTGSFQYRGNRLSIIAEDAPLFDYFLAKGRQKWHRHRLLILILIIVSTVILLLQAPSALICAKLPVTGFVGMLMSFVTSFECLSTMNSHIPQQSRKTSTRSHFSDLPLFKTAFQCGKKSSARFFYSTMAVA